MNVKIKGLIISYLMRIHDQEDTAKTDTEELISVYENQIRELLG